MRSFDFGPYRRSTVGFDRLFDYLEDASHSEQGDNYPPYDIERLSDDRYRITLAVAGFGPADLEITALQNMLTVAGRKTDRANRDGTFLHMGIASRAFERRFELADFVRVEGADLEDGLLSIDLVREIPDAMKPRKVEIRAGGAETVEAKRREAATENA